jgi:hypothetical protein
MENLKLLFIKKGDFKSGFFSKNASEFFFIQKESFLKYLADLDYLMVLIL